MIDNRAETIQTVSETAIAGLDSYALCGIELAQEFLDSIYKAKGISNPPKSVFNPEGDAMPEDVIRREVHCRAMDIMLRKLIEQGRASTILEVAAGMSPRGFKLARDYDINYIETDVSRDFELKDGLCRRVAEENEYKLRGKQSFLKLDAITLEGIDNVKKLLTPGEPIIITNAGLLGYYPNEKREQIVCNILGIMRDTLGSIWVTPDFGWLNTAFFYAAGEISPKYAEHLERVHTKFKERLGVDVMRFYEDEKAIEDDYKTRRVIIQKFGRPELGFDIQSSSLLSLQEPNRTDFMNLIDNHIKAWALQSEDSYKPVRA